MPFEITARREFSAAHQLRLYDGSLEPLHGHNWACVVTVSADKLDAIGVVMDFHELERLVDRDHRADAQPAPERARAVQVGAEPVGRERRACTSAAACNFRRGVRVRSVEVWETAANSAVYRP